MPQRALRSGVSLHALHSGVEVRNARPHSIGEPRAGDQMEGKLQLRIEYLDGTFYAEEIGMSWPAGQEATACMKLLADIKAVGGLLQAPDKNRITLRCWNSMKTISIEAPAIVSGDLTDLSRLGGAGKVTL